MTGFGLAFCFIPIAIAALTGVRPVDAGIASGLINTSQQIGGAIGLALVTTVATTYTHSYVRAHEGAGLFSPPALTHGFQITFWVLTGLVAVGVVCAVALLERGQLDIEEQPVTLAV
jgi:hypothetical protein